MPTSSIGVKCQRASLQRLHLLATMSNVGYPLESTPIVWPSLSDLAQLLGVKLSTISRLSNVRRRPMRRIGREVKVLPADAVAILVERGLSEKLATEGVRGVVDRRSEQIPALRAPSEPPDVSPSEARLVRSSFRPTDGARLERSNMTDSRPPAQPAASSMVRYKALDRRFGDRIIPIECYIYDDNR